MTSLGYVPTLVFARSSTATTYHLVPGPSSDAVARAFGWALATVNDVTGELSIQSDWGSWSYRWNVSPYALGAPSLTHFLSDRSSAHYLAGKLTSYSERHQFDPEESVNELCRRILKLRRDDELNASDARQLWDDLHGELKDTQDEQLFLERFVYIDNYDKISDDPWHDDFQMHHPSVGYNVLLYGILPPLIEACRKAAGSLDSVEASP